MYVQLELPEITETPDRFSKHGIDLFFRRDGTPVPYHIYAIMVAYQRLVDAALDEYRQARTLTIRFWNDHQSLQLGAVTRAAAYYESCLSNMHRATLCMVAIRKRTDMPPELQKFFPIRPSFTTDRIADRIRAVRAAIQHIDGDILNGNIAINDYFVISAHGPVTPVPGEPGQTLLTVDRLKMGTHEIMFADLCAWLTEMAQCAEKILQARLRPQQQPP